MEKSYREVTFLVHLCVKLQLKQQFKPIFRFQDEIFENII